MNTYLSYYPKGFQPVVEKALKSVISDADVLYLDETIIAYKTNASWKAIAKLTFFSTSFTLFELFSDPKFNQIRHMLKWAHHSREFYKKLKSFGHKNTTFRIVASGKDIDKKRFHSEIRDLERLIQQRYRLTIARGTPHFEIRFIEKNNIGFVGIRITKPQEQRTPKHSLPFPIASFMIYLSEPNKSDTFLDPFAGSGTIPILRAKYYPYSEVIASDKSLNHLRPRLRKEPTHYDNFTVIESSIQKLTAKLGKQVNKIVTDPPWGRMEQIKDEDELYLQIFSIFQEIVTSEGLIVLLTQKEFVIDSILAENKIHFHLIRKLEVKVSGRTSFVYKIAKK